MIGERPPRAWAAGILSGMWGMEAVPSHLQGLVGDHLANHRRLIESNVQRIMAMTGREARRAALAELPGALSMEVHAAVQQRWQQRKGGYD